MLHSIDASPMFQIVPIRENNEVFLTKIDSGETGVYYWFLHVKMPFRGIDKSFQ